MHYHFLAATVLFASKNIFFNLLCKISQITADQPFIYNLTKFTSNLFLFTIWFFILFTSTRRKSYFYKTGRNFRHDNRRYNRTYAELIEYFSDADPAKMNEDLLPSMDWVNSSGFVFGKISDKLICFEPQKNGICAMIWGAPGDGKTTSIIIPSCRQFGLKRDKFGNYTQTASVMVTDLKGDIYEANKNFRHIKRFSTIHWKESSHYDPLSEARKMTKSSDKALFIENLSITLIPNETGADAKYFVDAAREFFTGITLYLLNKDNSMSFPAIIEQIALRNCISWIIEIENSSDVSAQKYTNHFRGENPKNISGAYSKLVTCTRIFSTDILKQLLSNDGSCISPDDLENCIDIYIQIDPNQITLLGPLISMIYQSFMSSMLYRKEGQNPPIAFVIDEFGQIPAMPVISQSAALMRAYNCSLLFSCQSLAMLDNHYGIAGRKLLMDCVKTNCFLSIMDPDTRDYASRLIGTRRVLHVSNSEQYSQKNSSGKTVSEARERVFEPEAFGDLPNEDALIIYSNGKYIKAQKTYYFKTTEKQTTEFFSKFWK